MTNQKELNNQQNQAQAWLDKEYPLDKTCLGEFDKRNKDKTREEITELNISKRNLVGTDIQEEDFENLPKDLQIICWGKEAIIKQLGLDKNGKEAKKLRQTKEKDDFQKVLNEIIVDYAEKKLGSDLTSGQEERIKKIVERTGSAVAISAESLKKENLESELGNFKDEVAKIKKENKQNGMIASTIPLERLYVIRGNIKQFLKKWGMKKDENNLNEISIVNQFKIDKPKTGEVNEALKNLSDKIEEFLKIYDDDENGEIDIDELISKRDKLFEGLNRGELKGSNSGFLLEKPISSNSSLSNLKILGFYAIAEVVDDSNKRPEKTIFCYLAEGFGQHQIKSLQATARLVKENGTQVFTSLEEVAKYLNSEQVKSEMLTINEENQVGNQLEMNYEAVEPINQEQIKEAKTSKINLETKKSDFSEFYYNTREVKYDKIYPELP
ncbi:hypothetical protein C1645_743199 [Glomus cerebriforme]|uniref:EF-hand domain-containing protein n=1 Tax=Glomus cerebriforme TaxID=658196 RepID=A0A397SAA6_9GLOM|nr:hypothetical protein C1645_743199 [Glomus cerebriforme]